MSHRMLILKPGSTSTKVALFDGERCLSEEVVRHRREELAGFATAIDQGDLKEY